MCLIYYKDSSLVKKICVEIISEMSTDFIPRIIMLKKWRHLYILHSTFAIKYRNDQYLLNCGALISDLSMDLWFSKHWSGHSSTKKICYVYWCPKKLKFKTFCILRKTLKIDSQVVPGLFLRKHPFQNGAEEENLHAIQVKKKVDVLRIRQFVFVQIWTTSCKTMHRLDNMRFGWWSFVN